VQASQAELEELRQSIREFVAGSLASTSVRRVADNGDDFDAPVWEALAESMGLAAIGVPAAYGGADYSFAELGVVLEELGAALVPVPFLSSAVIATAALLDCGEKAARQRLLPGIAAGTTIATVVLGGLDAWPVPDRGAITATPDADRHLLTGSADFVLDAGAAGLLLVMAALDDGWGLFSVDPRSAGVERRRRAALDGTRPLYSVGFAAAEGTLLGRGPVQWAALSGLISKVSAALACEQAGGTARCLDMSVAYVKIRRQFDRPIGSFQAIKHCCADLLVELEAARSLAYHARDLAAAASLGLLPAAAAAGSWCTDTYVHVAQETIQLHGGIGFTWEHDAHLHLKRARAGQLLLGTPRAHRRALAEALGI
jgi:alkylation response protein AidB-like acyl-CoA dehydrogenase